MAAVGYGRDFDELEPVRRPVAAPHGSLSARPVVIDREAQHPDCGRWGGTGLREGSADSPRTWWPCGPWPGATGALVNLGGDLRCVGLAPEGAGGSRSMMPGGRGAVRRDDPNSRRGSRTSSPLEPELELLRWFPRQPPAGSANRVERRRSDRGCEASSRRRGWLAEVLTKTLLLAPRRRARGPASPSGWRRDHLSRRCTGAVAPAGASASVIR